MKIVVIGGSGLIGSQLVNKLNQLGHMVVPASPNSGVNTITGEGLREVTRDTDVVVDVSNSPSFEDNAVREFFEKSTTNILSAEAYNGVKHHVALSIVGAERLPDSGYLRAKVLQEELIRVSGIPFTILRSTQFFEFADRIAQSATVGNEVRVSAGGFQPIASAEVVAVLTELTVGKPLNRIVEVAGPARTPMFDFIRHYLTETEDSRQLVMDAQARYFGAVLDDKALVPAGESYLGKTRYEDWLKSQLSVV
jgi:uncharacterized protein YbjT (DUF2867 family)